VNALLTLIPGPYKWIALALLVVAVWGHGWLKGAGHEQAKFAAFEAEVAAEGRAAQKLAADRIAREIARKDASDASYQKALTLAGNDLKRLRDARPIGDILPAAPASSGSPDRACFDRTELERALRSLDAGVSGLAQEGDQIALRLKLAVEWAR